MVGIRTYSIIAGVTCCVSLGTGYMQILLENKIGSSEVCKKAINMLNEHKPSLDSLGPPIDVGRPSLWDKFTVISKSETNITIPVKGSISKGNLLISAYREDTDETWKYKYLKLSANKDDLIIFSEDST